MWEDANLLEVQVLEWLGTVSMKQQWFIFSALKDSLKKNKKNSQKLITYTFDMFVESDILVKSSKMCAGGSEFTCVSKKITSFFQEVHIFIFFLMCAEETKFY